ncbi:hypothetical protein D3C76_821900 [compost metagenome]
MNRLSRNYRLLLLTLVLIVIAGLIIQIAGEQASRKARENSPPYQYRTFVIEHIHRYLAEQPDGVDVWLKDPDFYLYSHASLTTFAHAIRNSTPLDYATYHKGDLPNESTSEELRFVLPGLEETFLYSHARLFCDDNQTVFQLTEDDGSRLFAIINDLRGN